MHPYIQHQLTNARLADMHSQAERHQIARAARRAASATQRPAAQPATGPGSVLDHALPPLRTTNGRRRQPGALAAQAPHGVRP
jgi:hypothetical protein